MPLDIVRNDICAMHVDAVVNSANPYPQIGRGVDSALHKAAGPSLIAERRRIGDIAVGQAAVTGAGRLPARYVIHTVGPIWRGGQTGELADVARCYRSCLDAAVRLGCASIAFPLISTGTYGFPKDLALRTATEEISAFLDDADLDVYLVVYDEESFQLSKNLFDDVANYLERRLEAPLPEPRAARFAALDAGARVAEAAALELDALHAAAFDDELIHADALEPEFDTIERAGFLTDNERAALADRSANLAAGALPETAAPLPRLASEPASNAAPASRAADAPRDMPRAKEPCRKKQTLPFRRRLEDVVGEVDESFADALLRLIDERGMTDPEVYKRANIDRKLFSKIRSNAGYRPSKATAVALAIALMLNLDETRDLIARAGYALTRASRGDIIVEYFIENGIWDIFQINEALFAFDEPLIGR